MHDFMDDTMRSVTATRTPQGGTRIDGRWVDNPGTPTTHEITLQPLSSKARESLERGGERIVDGRVIWINDGTGGNIAQADHWSFPGTDGTFRAVSIDHRPWRSYCKIVVSRLDD